MRIERTTITIVCDQPATTAEPESHRQCLRALPRAHRARTSAWPQRRRDLARPRQPARLPCALRQRSPLRPHAAWSRTRAGAPHHRDGPRRGGPGRLWRRPHGSRPRDGEVSPHTPLRAHARLLSKGGVPDPLGGGQTDPPIAVASRASESAGPPERMLSTDALRSAVAASWSACQRLNGSVSKRAASMSFG